MNQRAQQPNAEQIAEQRLRDVLSSYAGTDPAKLRAMIRFEGWQRFAFDEQQRRARRVVELLDDDLLAAIAERAVSMEHVATRLATELEAKRTS